MNLKELAAHHPVTITVGEEQRERRRGLAAAIARETGLSDAEATLLVCRGGAWYGRVRITDPEWEPPAGAQIALHTPPGGEYAALTIDEKDLLYEDAWLVALNKQPGWFAVATPWDIEATIEAALRRLYERRGGEIPRLHLSHRLDKDTSGVMLISKQPEINAALQALFDGGGVNKLYLALAAGTIEQESVTMRTGHGRGISGLFRLYPAELIGERIGPQQRAIKEAVTAFSVLERAEDATLVEARPHTGRTHQIRLHLAALGHPILGDRRYGGPQSVGELRIEHHLLHACELQLQHPASGELLTLRAPLPDHFAATLQELRKSLKT